MNKNSISLSTDEWQQTLYSAISFRGIGLFTGADVNCTITPLDENSGIIFQRIDLISQPSIKASITNATAGPRCTLLGEGNCQIYTVEHLLSAFYGLHVDNALVQLDGPEIPVFDGSARYFVEKCKEAGLQKQKNTSPSISIDQPIYVKNKDSILIALPSEQSSVHYTLSYPSSSLLHSQFHSFQFKKESYVAEISTSRTFSLYQDLEPLWNQGLLQHAGLENGVVIKDDIVLNPEGLRFKNEMARHKVLDIIGDFLLIGKRWKGQIIGVRSGHSMNLDLVRKLHNVSSFQQGALVSNEK